MTEFRIAATFTSALARLEAAEQKAAKTTAFDLQMDPAAPGLSSTASTARATRISGRYGSAATSALSSTRPRRASSWPMSATTTMPMAGPNAAGSRHTRAPAPSRSWKCGSG